MTRVRHRAYVIPWADTATAFIFVVGVAFLILIVSACGGPTTPLPTFDDEPMDPDESIVEQRATVARWVDGDTAVIMLEPHGQEARVRLLGADTPERGQCGYQQATDFMRSQAPVGTQVTLHVDPTQPDVDRFQRLLRHVHVGDRDLSQAVIEAGWAVHLDSYPVAASPQLEAAEHDAHTNARGIWGGVCT